MPTTVTLKQFKVTSSETFIQVKNDKTMYKKLTA